MQKEKHKYGGITEILIQIFCALRRVNRMKLKKIHMFVGSKLSCTDDVRMPRDVVRPSVAIRSARI